MKSLLHFTLAASLSSLFIGAANFAALQKIAKKSIYPAYEYQIRLEPDSTYIYSDGVLINTIETWKPGIDTTIWFNNR